MCENIKTLKTLNIFPGNHYNHINIIVSTYLRVKYELLDDWCEFDGW